MAAFRQLSTHIVSPRSNVQEERLNTHGQKFDPESLSVPIYFETLHPYLVNKSILDPRYIGLFGPFEFSPYG